MRATRKSLKNMARPERVELPTFWFVARRSIQLSYGRAALKESLEYDRHAFLATAKPTAVVANRIQIREVGPGASPRRTNH